MGVRQSKRSVDITTTPKKEVIASEAGDTGAQGKAEKIEDADSKPTNNGLVSHTESVEDKDKDETTEKDTEKSQEDPKEEDAKEGESMGESPSETVQVTTPTDESPSSPTATSPENKEVKKKDKLKKKWSFRSISFSKKDKSKPKQEDNSKNGDVTKDAPLIEGKEEAESPAAVEAQPESSPAEKSEVSSPTTTEAEPVSAEATAPEVKLEEKKEASEEPKPTKEKEEQIEEKKEEEVKEEKLSEEEKKPEKVAEVVQPAVEESTEKEVEKVSEKKVEVSAEREVESAAGSCVSEAIAAPSVTERKTSEDLPSQLPSSPPPTPIDPSPLQQAQQVAADASALVEALKAEEPEPKSDKQIEDEDEASDIPPPLPESPAPVLQEFIATTMQAEPTKEEMPLPPVPSSHELQGYQLPPPEDLSSHSETDEEFDEQSANLQICPAEETPIENNIIKNGMTEDEKTPPIDSSNSAPAITEDVASVTKAIQEIDINDKAVAAAVHEHIESLSNEIVADSNHQNILNE